MKTNTAARNLELESFPAHSEQPEEAQVSCRGKVLRTRILIVGSPWLARVVVHLFRGRAEFEVIGAASSLGSLGKIEGRLLPLLIVANVKPLSMGIRKLVRSIKRSSPSSKLILICPGEDFVRAARKSGADAYLKDEKLAGRLLPVARVLSGRLQTASARG